MCAAVYSVQGVVCIRGVCVGVGGAASLFRKRKKQRPNGLNDLSTKMLRRDTWTEAQNGSWEPTLHQLCVTQMCFLSSVEDWCEANVFQTP